MNQKGEKKVLRTWSRASVIFPRWLGIPLPFMMDAAMFRFTLPRTWSVTVWASLPRRTFRGHMAGEKSA